jgi:protease-4
MVWRLWLGIRLALHYVGEVVQWLTGRKRPYAVVQLTLRGPLSEGPSSGFWSVRRPQSFFELVTTLQWAREDNRVKGVFVHCDQAELGWAQVLELHRSLLALRKAGKRVHVALGQATLAEYVVASAAEKIVLSPAGGLDIAGLSTEVWFLTRALEKLGIRPEFVQVGEYKSAAEIFTRTEMSAAHREAIQAIVNDLLRQLAEAVAQGRGWNVEQAVEMIEGGPYDPESAVTAGLVDALADPVIAERELHQELELDSSLAIDFQTYNRRKSRALRPASWRFGGEHIAVVHVVGALFDGPAPPGAPVPPPVWLLRDLQQLAEDPRAKAVVLRVVSPGGSALWSDRLWQAATLVATRKPVVASCGDVAASGGYYLALAGRPLFAEASTLTGSIGVVAGKFVLRGLLEHLGIDTDRVARGKYTGLSSSSMHLTEEERALLQRNAERFYARFLELVSAARDLDTTAAREVARGRVWSGAAAAQNGLVDGLGGLEEALASAKLLAGWEPLEHVPVVHYPRPRPLWQTLAEQLRPERPIPLPPTTGVAGVWAWLPIPYKFR